MPWKTTRLCNTTFSTTVTRLSDGTTGVRSLKDMKDDKRICVFIGKKIVSWHKDTLVRVEVPYNWTFM